MNVQTIIEGLPPLYAGFFPDFFQEGIPRESAATCTDCAMWAEPGKARPGTVSFSRQTKCCTYHPALPNYLIGATLSSTDRDTRSGRARVRHAIRDRFGVTPRGLLRPRKHALLYEHTPRAFGRGRSLLCPYYDSTEGGCTLRPFWPAICKTWFCKHVAGADGWAFWMALKSYLFWVEEVLVDYTRLQLNCPPQGDETSVASAGLMTLQELEQEPPSERAYSSLWGEWAGREEAFYKEAFCLVSALTRGEFERLAGVRQKLLLGDLRRAHASVVSPKLPSRLRRRKNLTAEKLADGSYLLVGYSPYDPLRVSPRVYEILESFDGRKTHAQIRELLRARRLPQPDDALLLSLHQARLLVDCDE